MDAQRIASFGGLGSSDDAIGPNDGARKAIKGISLGNNQLYVNNQARQKIQIFDLSGNYVESRSLTFESDDVWPDGVRVDSGGGMVLHNEMHRHITFYYTVNTPEPRLSYDLPRGKYLEVGSFVDVILGENDALYGAHQYGLAYFTPSILQAPVISISNVQVVQAGNSRHYLNRPRSSRSAGEGDGLF